jgi:aminoglycoside N3'-acetyltransferase
MRDVSPQQVTAELQALGIVEGDGLLVHSAIQYLGRPVGGVGMYMEAIQAVIGTRGTIAVPTFNFAFAKGESYDPGETPSQGMGAFSEYIREHPGARRTLHPMQSLAVIGHLSEDLAARDTLSAFDPGSAFERMLDLDFKLLLLGAHVSAVSIFHYSEQRNQVPYRYWKDFAGQVRTADGWQKRKYRMFVRLQDPEPVLTADPVQSFLQARGQWLSRPLNYGSLAACRLVDFVAAVDHFLSSDPWSLVTNRDEFV